MDKTERPRTPADQFQVEFEARSAVTQTEPVPVEIRLGAVVRRLRLEHNLTLAELAAGAGISTAMMSRLETGAAAASIDVMERVAQALGVQMSFLFRMIESPSGEAQLLKVADQAEVVRTGTRHGHTYRVLSFSKGHRKSFEAFLITMDNEKQAYPRFQHAGTEFIYMLKGRLRYRCGSKVYDLDAGDALTFPGKVIHGPEDVIDDHISFITVIMYEVEE
ncbi:XRE family transcriptional regulator [Rhizobium sp. PP-F2F-G36]|nr:XRE family transcriptional regulator [Rhizobium sp. PP-F2F-G36]